MKPLRLIMTIMTARVSWVLHIGCHRGIHVFWSGPDMSSGFFAPEVWRTRGVFHYFHGDGQLVLRLKSPLRSAP